MMDADSHPAASDADAETNGATTEAMEQETLATFNQLPGEPFSIKPIYHVTSEFKSEIPNNFPKG